MKDPFKITGPAVVSFSGGRTSGYMLHRILGSHGGTLPGDVRVVFCNTGKERPETLDFVERCSQQWGVPVTWLEYRTRDDGRAGFAEVDYATASRNGEPFEADIQRRKFLPNPVNRYCTQELKLRPLSQWCRSLGWERWESAVGIRADEPHRLSKARAAKTGRSEVVHPLGQAGVTLSDIQQFWSSNDFDLALEPHEGNCDLCFLKGAGRIRRILAERPDLAEWWIRQEATVVHNGGGFARFRKDRPGYAAQLDLAGRKGLFDVNEPDELSIACACTD